MKRRRSTDWGLVGGIVGFILIIVLTIGSFWLHFAAPCKYVTWMPSKDVPSRCLEIRVR